MADMQDSERSSSEAELIQKAQSDPQFRQQLLSNPNQAVQQALGINLPSGVELKVVEESPSTYYLVLPAAQAQSDFVSDEALQAASGDSSSWGPNCHGC